MIEAAEGIVKFAVPLSLPIYRWNASNLFGKYFIIQHYSEPKHTANTTKDFIREMW